MALSPPSLPPAVAVEEEESTVVAALLTSCALLASLLLGRFAIHRCARKSARVRAENVRRLHHSIGSPASPPSSV